MSSDYRETNETSSSSSDTDSSVSSDEIDQHDENLRLEGLSLRNYNIITEIGRGGYAIVWLAYNIQNGKFSAIKIQNHMDYKDGLDELKILKQLPHNLNYFNNLLDYFIEKRKVGKKTRKYLCMVFELCTSNLDTIIRKGDFKEGLPLDMIKKSTYNVLKGLDYIHNKLRVFHGDIKPDNLLLMGLNDRDNFIISEYSKSEFPKKYRKAKEDFIISKGKEVNPKTLKKISSEDKVKLRELVNYTIVSDILVKLEKLNLSKYTCQAEYINNASVVLCDFGSYCSEDDEYEGDFGTRYYRAPEIILMGDCSTKLDIWALGCTIYELITGKILFDPEKDSDHDRNYYHLKKINQMCGRYSRTFLRQTKFYKDYFQKTKKSYKLKETDHTLEKINLKDLISKNSKLNENEIDLLTNLLEGMLQINPKDRFTARNALSSPFFNNIN